MSRFLKDLREGQAGESRLVELFRRAGMWAEPAGGRSSDVRVWVGGAPLTAEVKHDRVAARTGNIAIEYRNCRSGKPAGILASGASLWVTVLDGGGIWAAPTAEVREAFETLPGREVRGAGDGNADLKLFPAAVLLGPVMTRLDTMHPAEVGLFVIDCSIQNKYYTTRVTDYPVPEPS